ncbi:Outer-membrane lipoprotein LolB [Andreprevotia sp. IGB-42]|uniref:lipoprotein insertase outer membrane protein LolB n=1 Tax=Andreprevotia sp. IGB-42 TaxID=2497473 RepID=UPI001358DDAC|nr:lipoprotein insertase outer membrane protein LolB [Andreprevotia sp. IGB-42]KAF0814651.1 Outer-membrane lipoprotein LolB [Andreprevotia sp. IGB-42]
MRLFVAVLLAAWLAGCAAPGQPPAQRADFAADGRLAIRGEIDGNKVSETANFRWKRSGERTEVELGSPLGETQARLTFDAGGAELIDSRGTVRQAGDADALLFDATGYAIPVTPLRWWLEGKPAPDAPLSDDATDAAGARRFAQAGWQVSLGAPSPLYPKLIQLKRDALDVRIAVTDWP